MKTGTSSPSPSLLNQEKCYGKRGREVVIISDEQAQYPSRDFLDRSVSFVSNLIRSQGSHSRGGAFCFLGGGLIPKFLRGWGHA